MESLIPILLKLASNPQVTQLLPLVLNAGKNLFPQVPDDKAPAAVATALSTEQTKWTQTFLKMKGEYTGEVDGVYGAGTKAAVMKYQQSKKLVADGWAGNDTGDSMRADMLEQIGEV